MIMKKHVALVPIVAIALMAGIGIGLYWAGEQDQMAGAIPGAIPGASMHQAGPFRLRVSVNPEAPTLGENTVLITLTDLNGAPVDGAEINVVATMLAMGAMPEMREPATIEQTAPGRYEGPFT